MMISTANRIFLISCVLVLASSQVALGQMNFWFVSNTANPTKDCNDCLTVNTFNTFDKAICCASTGDLIMVSPGTYTGVGNRDIRVDGQDKAVAIFCWDGTSSNCTAVVDCQRDNVPGFIITTQGIMPSDSQVVLSGIKVTKCAGGGLRTHDSIPTISNCIFTDNGSPTKSLGGGVEFGGNSQAKLINCTIDMNKAMFGAGVFMNSGAPTLDNCTISNNDGELGGGIYIEGFAKPIIKFTTIADNTATIDGGGIHARGAFSNPFIANTQIVSNTAGNAGGGVDLFDVDTATMVNCIVTGNSSAIEGGGLRVRKVNSLQNKVKVISSTFWSNTTTTSNQGGGAFISDPDVTLSNNIFWGNKSGSQFRQIRVNNFVKPFVAYNDVQNGQSGASGCTGSCWGQGNINMDPLFVDPDGPDDVVSTWQDNNLKITSLSPVIDAANDNALPQDVADIDNDTFLNEITPLDFDLNFRECNEPSVPDTGLSGCAISDMGAFEVCGGNTDCNGNGTVDICECPAANIDFVNTLPPNGTVDARQPHNINDVNDLLGIGDLRMPNQTAAQDDITIVLDAFVAAGRAIASKFLGLVLVLGNSL